LWRFFEIWCIFIHDKGTYPRYPKFSYRQKDGRDTKMISIYFNCQFQAEPTKKKEKEKASHYCPEY
jgi:hypothetical protein